MPAAWIGAATVGLCLLGAVPAGAAGDFTIAAASDLQTVMPSLTSAFQKATGQTVRVTYGSSGNFFSQIQNGAPFDLFMSADVSYPRQLDAAGLTEPRSIVIYGAGRIVVWARKDSMVEVPRGLAALTAPAVKHIAVANPDHAPYGRAAVAALQHEHLYDRLKAKLILGENVSQAATFVESGNAEAGIIALSLALSPALRESGAYALIPPDSYPPLEQAAVIIRTSRNKAAARAFLAFIERPEITRVMQAYGFAQPPAGRGR